MFRRTAVRMAAGLCLAAIGISASGCGGCGDPVQPDVPTGSNAYMLAVGAVGPGTVTPIAGEYNEGTVVALTATPDPGARIRYWQGADRDPSAGVNANTVTMTYAKTLPSQPHPAPDEVTAPRSAMRDVPTVSSQLELQPS